MHPRKIGRMSSLSDIGFLQWQGPSAPLCGSVHYSGSPSGTWVIFVHGFTGQRMGPGYLFVKVSRSIFQFGVSSFRFDFAGCGESGGEFPQMTFSTMVRDVISAVDQIRTRFNPGKIILLGHSLGGAVAAQCATEVSANGLILLAPVSDPLGLTQRRKDTVLKAGTNRNGYYENGPHEMSMDFLKDLGHYRPLEALRGFTGPMIVFQGELDPSVSPEESGRYAQWAASEGVECGYHTVKDNDHNFSTVAGVQYLCTSINQWIQGHFS